MADAPKIAPDTRPNGTEAARNAPAPKADGDYRIADIRADDAVLEMEDGRVFVATFGDNVDRGEARRGMRAVITADGFDSSDAPKDARITRVHKKDD